MGFLKRYRVPLVLVGLGVVVITLVAHRVIKQQAAAVPRRQIEVVVAVVKPVKKDLDVKLAYTADVLPARQVAVFAKVSGYIRRLPFDRGDFVREGQILVEIEAQELNGAVEQARAAVATADANLKVAESNLESARANYANQEANVVRARAVADNDVRNAARLEDLHQRGLISAMDRDNSKTTADSSKAALAASDATLVAARSQIATQQSQVALARANIERERATLRIAQTNLDNTRLAAPFAGYISARNLDVGAAVNSQAAGTSNSSVGILVVQDLSMVKVQVEIEERHVSLVRIGSVARVLVDAYPGKVFEAKAIRIVHALDPRSRTLGVEMEIPNKDHVLKPGMYARVELVIDHHPGAILVPGEAIVTDGEKSAVFLVKDSIVERRPVTTGVSEGTTVEVTKGLTGEEMVIIEGKELVREKQKVRVAQRGGGAARPGGGAPGAPAHGGAPAAGAGAPR
jgi:membrane fusion protein (multidrug efflux system)